MNYSDKLSLTTFKTYHANKKSRIFQNSLVTAEWHLKGFIFRTSSVPNLDLIAAAADAITNLLLTTKRVLLLAKAAKNQNKE
jgi:hypothetical protein